MPETYWTWDEVVTRVCDHRRCGWGSAEAALRLYARWIPMWWRPHANHHVRVPIDGSRWATESVCLRDRMRDHLRRELSARHGAGEVVVRRAAVIRLLRLPQQETTEPTAPTGVKRPPMQAKRGAARRAVKKVYPQGVPDQTIVPNIDLVDAVIGQLKVDGITYTMSPDTILRAAGRKK